MKDIRLLRKDEISVRQNQLKGGVEYDAINAKHRYKYIWHHSHNVKKRLARRARREARQRLTLTLDNLA